MALVKDAQYYLDRINDLSSSLLSQIKNLKKAVNSSRFVCLTINELCQKLLDNLKEMLISLSQDYPKNIKVESEE